MIVDYRSTNSGGGWWLEDEHWFALEDAGWVVHWSHPLDQTHEGYDPGDDENDPHNTKYPSFGHSHSYGPARLVRVERPDPDDPEAERWLGALATSASRETDSPQAAVEEWERVTGQDASAEGCNCCGEPHSFSWEDDDGGYHYTSVEVTSTSLRFS